MARFFITRPIFASVLSIITEYPGASPELVEMYLSSPIETAAQAVRGVRRTSSESRDGQSTVTVELQPDVHVQVTRLAILERLGEGEDRTPMFVRAVRTGDRPTGVRVPINRVFHRITFLRKIRLGARELELARLRFLAGFLDFHFEVGDDEIA